VLSNVDRFPGKAVLPARPSVPAAPLMRREMSPFTAETQQLT
jgi:hypothetical protein